MSEDEMMSIEVQCPIKGCTSKKTIQIPAHILKAKAFGSVKVQIPKNQVCPDHQFMLFVDKRGRVRGSEGIDLQLGGAKG